MDANRFDALTRILSMPGSRRAALGAFGAGLAGIATAAGSDDAEGKRRRKKKCGNGKKTCGANKHCVHGKCKPCLAQGTACTTDNQCCTGICDKYTNRCQQVRVSCADGEQCPHGRCCDSFGTPQCLYEKATQGACEPEVSCGYLLCGDKCSDLENGTYQFCGFEGSASCRNGKCCCPKGVPLTDCPDIQQGGEALLPRCP